MSGEAQAVAAPPAEETGEVVAAPATRRAGAVGLFASRHWALGALLALTIVSLGLRLLWLDKPQDALIFDESYYVNAARVLIGITPPEKAPYAASPLGLDPNKEHPPLGKLLIARAILAFGDNAWGWRLASVLFGTLSVPLVYGIARRAGAGAAPALLATFCYAFDNLVFVHGRIGTLDIFVVALLLLGVLCYLDNRPIVAGVVLAAATLCKIGGLYGVGAILLFEALRAGRERLATGRWAVAPLRAALLMLLTFVVVCPLLLGVLDRRWGQIANPFEHIAHIFRYGFALTRAGGPQGQESAPWQWLLNEVQMGYLRTDSQVIVSGVAKESRPLIFFRGAMNPLLIGILPLAIGYAAHRAWTRRADLSFLTVALFVATYLPFWPAALIAHRISYIFYFLPTIPAVALGAASFLHDPAMPRAVRWAFVGAFLLGFYGYFPFRVIP